ncbi:interleukin-6 receptor subunit beta isoform X2 [Sinocyclocheilus rhinocerous]|uniref:interleukin-6 receptor subunit beta isoform X2 n=1 Tax=Sinocyclocheilus rhinocerous TaxID=307959 RepID=UPI0007B9C8D1|nr:PREDICTED: interleukin-6 receptor subunit beta-like isoform X2 [Sinocyclocheilus rhinocerous]
MRMRVAVLVLVVSVSLTEARCVPTSSPHCYKTSTRLEEDFICEWDERNPEKSQTHTLHIWDTEKNSFRTHVKCSKPAQVNILLEELGIPSRTTDIWVQTQVGKLTCNSSKISVILECMVKYSKPQIISMKRSAGILNLTLDKPKDNRGAIYEIRWRERDSEWQNTTFETKDSTIEDFHMLHLQSQTIYQIQLRRQAKLKSHLCKDSLHALWSDWSQMVDVPSEIRRRPVIRWVENNPKNGTRDINLFWDAPPAEESVGGVKYILRLSDWPCNKTKRKKQKTMNQTYNASITYSEARISIIAVNKVGHSPRQQLIIPAVKHLNYCDSDMPSNITKADNNTCLEWYKLEDGETRPRTVYSSEKKLLKDIKNEVEHFVRHYYFLHTIRNKQYQTAVMCPFYSKQKAPVNGPANVNVSDVTHESTVVSWLSIPVAEQQGFLQHYVIWISGQGNTKFHKVPANKTSFLIKDLHPGASYTVSISGRTEAGNGPNSTVNFETHSKEMGLSWQDQTILIVCVVALLCTIICSVAARRLKLLPEVPSPVIDAAEFRCPEEQDQRPMIEEVHEFVLLLRQDLGKRRENVTPEQSTLLQDFGLVVFEEEEEEDGEGGVTDLSSMKSCCYPNPSYRGQMLQLPEPFHMTDSTSRDNDTESTYRDGLFFETRVLECDKTSL